MLKMVDGTGIIGIDMISPLGVPAPQPPNYDKVEMEGTGILVLPNSLNAQLERLELGGKTEQVQTTGKNLFDFSNLESGRINISTGALEEHNHTRRLADYIDITDITSYSIYLPGYNKANGAVYVVIYYYDKDKKYLSYRACGDKQEKYENIAPVENAVYIKATLEQNTIDNPQNIFKVQLEKGAKSTDYEPYTGGKPSPSQEYQQEVKNSGKWNEEKQKYEVSVKVTGKNLFDMNKFIDTCNFTKNEDGTFIIDKYVERYDCFIPANTILSIEVLKVEDSSGAAALELFYEDGKSMYIGFGLVGVKTFLIQKDVAYIKVLAYRKHEYKYIQLEKGRTATPYEPYKEQTLTLTSDRPITKWDKLVEQDGQIGWLYAGVVIDRFDGQSNKISIANKQGNVQNFSIRFENVANGNGNSDIFVDKYRAVQLSYAKAEYGICCNWNDGVKYFSAPNENVATVDDFKAWLIENPLKIAYETTNPEFVPLPQSEQNAIRALKTYYPTTVITADGGELDPDIKVTYRKEI